MQKVFVSYARDESKKVYRILAKLEAHGIKFWVDTRDIENGKDWPEEISKAIENCSKFLLFMSHKSMVSDNIKNEVQIGFEKHKKIVILRLDDATPPNKLNYALTGKQWTDHSSTTWETEIIAALVGIQKNNHIPKTDSVQRACPANTRPVKALKPQAIILELETVFSVNETTYKDQCAASISKIEDLRTFVGNHWVNQTFAYKELIPRVYLLEKINIIQNMIRDFQDTCPPGSSAKRKLIHAELKTLSQELSRKVK
jgi:hypothetical protein